MTTMEKIDKYWSLVLAGDEENADEEFKKLDSFGRQLCEISGLYRMLAMAGVAQAMRPKKRKRR